MDLDRGFASSDFGGYLLVEKPGNYQRQHLSLTRCQPLKTLPQCRHFRLSLASGPVALQRELDRVQKILISEWLGQELDGSRLHGPDRHGNVAVPGNKDDGNGDVGL